MLGLYTRLWRARVFPVSKHVLLDCGVHSVTGHVSYVSIQHAGKARSSQDHRGNNRWGCHRRYRHATRTSSAAVRSPTSARFAVRLTVAAIAARDGGGGTTDERNRDRG